MGEALEFDDRGGGELFLPVGAGRQPAVIICHEWFGLTDEMRRIAKRFASEGFVAFAADFFEGKSTSDKSEAFRLANEMKTTDAMKTVAAAREYLADHPRCTGRVGVTGFCLGGGMALAAASSVDGLSAVVPFYGLPRPKYFDAANVSAPVQGHYARQDEYVPRERVEAIWAELIATPAEAQLFFYEAGHAFMRETDPSTYEPEDAEVAWARMLSFFRRHLVEGA